MLYDDAVQDMRIYATQWNIEYQCRSCHKLEK